MDTACINSAANRAILAANCETPSGSFAIKQVPSPLICRLELYKVIIAGVHLARYSLAGVHLARYSAAAVVGVHQPLN